MSTKYLNNTFELKEVPKDVEDTRTIPFIINADVKDRHKDVLNYDNWDLTDFNANPVVGYQHNIYGDNMCAPENPDYVLGKASNTHVDLFRGKRVLLSDVTFEPKSLNEMADKVMRKVLFGSLRAASVGILPYGGKIRTEQNKDAQGNVTDITNFWPGQTLLEWSIVNIPANQESVRRSMKNHTYAALDFAARVLSDYSHKQLKEMKVQEILDLLEKKDVPLLAEVEKGLETSGPDPNFNKYNEFLTKRKNGQAKS